MSNLKNQKKQGKTKKAMQDLNFHKPRKPMSIDVRNFWGGVEHFLHDLRAILKLDWSNPPFHWSITVT